MDNSEAEVVEEDELDALSQLEEEDEEEKKLRQATLDPEEVFFEGEEEPTSLEGMFPDAPYTVYYQQEGGEREEW